MVQQTPSLPPSSPPGRNRGPLIVVGVLVLAVVVLVGLIIVVVLRKDGGESHDSAPRTPAGVEFHRVVKATPAGCGSPATTPRGAVCGADGTAYTLGKVELNGAQVSGATAAMVNGSWAVTLDLTEEGGRLFEQLTTAVSKESPPANQLAIVVDGRVVSAPSVMSPITGGQVQISGRFTQQEAERLAAAVSG